MMSKKKLAALVGALSVMVSAYATPSMAISLGFGATGGAIFLSADGSEKLAAPVAAGGAATTAKKGQENINGVMPSIYAQITIGEERFGEGNGFVIGYDMGIGKASKTVRRSEVKNQNAANDGTGDAGATESSTSAEAEVSNLNTIYIETPGFTIAGIYLRAGWSEMDVKTTEDLITLDTVGDGSIDGFTYGVGFKKSLSGFQIKTEFNYTDFDTLALTSASGSVYKATPEAWTAKLGIGYNF